MNLIMIILDNSIIFHTEPGWVILFLDWFRELDKLMRKKTIYVDPPLLTQELAD